MTGDNSVETVRTSSIKTVALASFIGTAIEWYDYFVYGTAAALVFGKVFFPDYSPVAGTLASFATFAVGFFARPVGGIVIGHFGDRVGRRTMLILTLLVMGIGTFVIGLLPTYQQIGIWAPILLVVLRIFQGFGIGGEWGGAVLMAVEHSPSGKRGFYGSWPQVGVPAGLALGTGAVYLVATLPEDSFLSWGWRIPFLFSIVMVTIGLYIRLRVLETPAFQQVKQTQSEARLPVLDVFRVYPRSLLIGMGLRMAENGFFYLLSVFVLTYVTNQLGLPENLALMGVMVAAVLEIFTVPAFGALTDRIGRRPVYMFGAVFSLLFVFPFFWLLNTGTAALIWLAIVIALAVGHGAMYGVQGALFSELFGTRVRYSGASTGYQLASVFAGGLSPIIAVALLGWADTYWPVGIYMCVLAMITIAAVYFASESYRDDIYAPHVAEQRHLGATNGETATGGSSEPDQEREDGKEW